VAALASTFEQRRPQRPGGMGRGAMLALLVHAGLLIAIAFGVSWRSSEPAGTTAELWAAVPQAAAPAAAPPPPMPKAEPKPEPKPEVKAEPPPPPPKPDTRDADIAIEKAKAAEKDKREREEREKAEKLEREKQARAEREKAERERREAAEKAERAEKAAQAQAEDARKKMLERMLGQAGATGAPQATGTAQRDAGPSANYAGKIVARVRPNIVLTDSVPPALRAEVEVRAAPDGTITGRRLTKPSGNASWDEAVLRAIDRTGELPKDDNGRVPSSIVIGFTPT
jgi:colicin import membrane protein